MLIKSGRFLFVFIKLLFFVNIDEVSSCALSIFNDDGCCKNNFWGSDCNGLFKPNCNIFEANCVGCTYIYNKANACSVRVYCSCYYCCESKYAESCPDGCWRCVKDGEGGCSENMAGNFKSIGGNSSSSMLETKTKARQHFDMIDVDKNGSISLNEAVDHLGSKLDNGKTTGRNVAKNVSWFAEIDRNANNQIEPGEFDRSLIGGNNQTSG
uniref:EF-hand domain-containing protein n=1 Tax=Globodera rostochiensis TaxID=31243 RepID=A0A914HTN0_GLORO